MADRNQTVGIQVKGISQDAINSLQKLAEQTDKFKGKLLALVPAFNSVNKLANGLRVLSNLDFTKLEKGISNTSTALQGMSKSFATLDLSGINNQVSQSAETLNKLANATNKISKLDGVKLNIDTSSLNDLQSKLSNINFGGMSFKTITDLANGLQKLQNLDFTNIQSGGKEISYLDSQIEKAVSSTNSLSNSLSSVKYDSIKNVSSSIRSFVNSLEKVNKTDLGNIDKAFQRMASGIDPFLKKLEESKEQLRDLATVARTFNTKNMVSQMNNVSKSASIMSSRFFNLSYWTAKLSAMWFTFKRGLETMNKFISLASNYNETLNLYQRSMGELTDVGMEFVNKMNTYYGIGRKELMQYQATFKNMLSTMGSMAEDSAVKLSETLTRMSLDYASLYNVSFEDAMVKFQAALTQQVRPIRSESGYDITKNTLQEALDNAGIDATYSKLSQVEKRLAIILALQQQMANTNAFGDLASTIEQPANQLRVLQAELKETGEWIGKVFMGTIGKILPYINAFIIAIKKVVKSIAILLGYRDTADKPIKNNIFDSIGVGATNADEALDDVNKKIDKTKRKLAGFDEITIIGQEPTDSGGNQNIGGAGVSDEIIGALADYDDYFKDIQMRAEELSNEFLSWLGFQKEWNEETGEWVWKLADGETRLGKIIDVAKGVGIALVTAFATSKIYKFAKATTEALKMIGKVGSGIWAVIKAPTTLFNSVSKPIKDAFGKGFSGVTAMATTVLTAVKTMMTGLFSSIGSLFTGKGLLASLQIFSNSIISAFSQLGTNVVLALKSSIVTGLSALGNTGIGTAIQGMFGVGAVGAGSIMAVIAAIIGAFAQLYLTVENFRNTVNEFLMNIWDTIKVIIDWVMAVVQPLIDGIIWALGGLVNLWNGFVALCEPFFTIILDFFNALMPYLNQTLANLTPIFDVVGSFFELIFVLLGDLLGAVGELLSWLGSAIMEFYENNKGWIDGLAQFIGLILEGISATFGTVFAVIDGIIQTFVAICKGDFGAIGDIWKGVWDKASKMFSGFIDGVKKLFQGVWDFVYKTFIKPVADFFGNLGKMIGDGLKSVGNFFGDLWDGFTGIFGFADGGHPAEGQLFIAREAGPELVGTMNGRNTVANNDDITVGIYNAVLSAMQHANVGNDNGGGEFHLYIDGKEITNTVVKRVNNETKRTGTNPLLQG